MGAWGFALTLGLGIPAGPGRVYAEATYTRASWADPSNTFVSQQNLIVDAGGLTVAAGYRVSL